MKVLEEESTKQLSKMEVAVSVKEITKYAME